MTSPDDRRLPPITGAGVDEIPPFRPGGIADAIECRGGELARLAERLRKEARK